MALQTGVGLSKILIIAGAAYTGTILLKNGKLSDILSELQGLEKSGEQSDDATILAQVRRLSTEIRQLASTAQITVNGDSYDKLSTLVIPAATLGALGYGYMWWKGISFSNLLWVTKRNVENAVENLTKNLDSVLEAFCAAKKHLIQRIQKLDDKMEIQKEISKNVQESVEETHLNFSNIEYDLDSLLRMISSLDEKMDSVEFKQDRTIAGILYLCNMVEGKKAKLPEILQEQLKLCAKSHTYLLTHSGTPTLKGLKDVAYILPRSTNDSERDAIVQNGI